MRSNCFLTSKKQVDRINYTKEFLRPVITICGLKAIFMYTLIETWNVQMCTYLQNTWLLLNVGSPSKACILYIHTPAVL